MANIREVAAKAGVSRSTVSLVLNNSPLVKAETREKVLAVIQELHYVPNSNARSLSTRVMNSLGVIVLSEHSFSDSYDFQYDTGQYSTNIINGISARLTETDYSMIMEHYSPQMSGGELPKLIRSRRVDGAFIIGGFGLYNQDFIEQMKETGIPFVMIGVGMAEVENDSVWADPREGVYLSMRYLVETGHQKICFINCPKSFRSNYVRIEGLERSIRELGVDFDWNWMIDSEYNSGLGGYMAIRKLWESGARPDSLVVANAPIALGAMRYLYEQKVRIPDDISIVAYEDNILCGYATPALTTINIQKEYMGKRAADMLLERLASPNKEWEMFKSTPYLVERESVRRRDLKD